MVKVGTYYFIGIGGIGMSSIAKYLVANNFKVGGYDLTKTDITETLEKNGIEINYKDELNSIPSQFTNQDVIVIFTPELKYVL